MPTILDYSAGRPTAAAVKAAGHVGVIRYIGTPGRTKNLTRAEYQDMVNQVVGVGLVYENRAGDAAGGYAAGVNAARAARADADAVGYPSSRPIYFAVDSDQVTAAQFQAAMNYLDGAVSVLGFDQVGVYGEYDIVEMAVGKHCRYGWQTAAWSGGRRSGKAHLYQKIGTAVVGGIACDVNDILATDWGQHNAQEDDMPTAKEIVDEWMSRLVSVGEKSERFLPASGILQWTNVDTSATRAMVTQLLAAQQGGASADEIAAKLLPALTSALVAEVAHIDAVSDEDAQQIAKAVTDRAATLLGGAQ